MIGVVQLPFHHPKVNSSLYVYSMSTPIYSHLQCFDCKCFFHISSNFSSRAPVIKEREDVVDGLLDVQLYELEEFDDLGEDEDTFLGCI